MGTRADSACPASPMLTNHAHVLLCLAAEPDIRCRDVAARTGVSERCAQGVIAQLIDHGYLTRVRHGRRNRYELHPDAFLRLPVGGPRTVGELLAVLGTSQPTGPSRRPAPLEGHP